MLDVQPGPGKTRAADPRRSGSAVALVQHPTPTGAWVRVGAQTTKEAHRARVMRPRSGDARFLLLIGAPGEELPTAHAVAEAVRDLNADTRARMVVTVYGSEPEGEPSLALQLARVLDTPIRSHHGFFVTDPDGLAHTTAIDSADRPTWRPFTELTTYTAGQAGQVDVTVNRWHAPFRQAVSLGSAAYRLTEDWVVEVIPAGLLVRPSSHWPNPLLRCAPTHPDRVDLVVDCPDGTTLPDDVLTAVGRFADSLPSDARSRLRLVPTVRIAERSGHRLRWAVPAPAVIWSPPRSAIPVAHLAPSTGAQPMTASKAVTAKQHTVPEIVIHPPARLASVLVVTASGCMRLS